MAASDMDKLRPVYLVWSTEELLVEEGVARLRALVAASGEEQMDTDVFDGAEADAADVVARCNTLPFLSERRLVVIRDIEKMPAAGQAVLADYASDPAPFTTLVLAAGKPDKRTRLYKALDEAGWVSEFKAPKRAGFGRPGEYGARVVEMFTARGKRIGRQAAEQLVESVGEDLRRLSVEIGKACAYVGDAETVTVADVEAVLSLAAPTSVWDFLDAFGERNVREALKLLAGLLSEGETPMGLWGLTLMHLRRLLAARAMLDRGDRTQAIMVELGLKSEWHCRKIEGQARRFSAEELERALCDAAATEADMKTSRDARLALERWIARACGRGA